MRFGYAALRRPRQDPGDPPRRTGPCRRRADGSGGDLIGFRHGWLSGRVWDSGAGCGTVADAIDEGVPTRVLTAALYEGISCWEADFADRMFSALCRECGGREEKAGRS